jgi:hypothetical protein
MKRGQFLTITLSKDEVNKIEAERLTAYMMSAIDSFKEDGYTDQEIMERLDLVSIDVSRILGVIDGRNVSVVDGVEIEVFWKDTPKVQEQKTDCCERPFDENNPDPHHPEYIEEIDGRK